MATPSSSPKTVKFAPLPQNERAPEGSPTTERLAGGGSLYRLGSSNTVLSGRSGRAPSPNSSTVFGATPSSSAPLAASVRRFNLSMMDESIASNRSSTRGSGAVTSSSLGGPTASSNIFSAQRAPLLPGVPTRASLLRGNDILENSTAPRAAPAKVNPSQSFSSVALSSFAAPQSAGKGASRLLLKDDQMQRAVQVFGAPASEHDGVLDVLRYMCGTIELYHTVRTQVVRERITADNATVKTTIPAKGKVVTETTIATPTTAASAEGPSPLGALLNAFIPLRTAAPSISAAHKDIPWRRETVSLGALTDRPRPLNIIFETAEAAATALSLSGTLEHNGRRLGVSKLSEVNKGSMFFFDYDDDCYFRPATLRNFVNGVDSTVSGKKRVPLAGKVRSREEDDDAIAALTSTTKVLRTEADTINTHAAVVAQLGGTRLPTTPACRVRFPRLMALPLAEYWLLPFIRVEPKVEDCDPWRGPIPAPSNAVLVGPTSANTTK